MTPAERFRSLHNGPDVLLLPNAWDLGSAKLFESLGYLAFATTSGGHAMTLGRADGQVTLDEALEHARWLASGTDLPLNVDFEDGFARDPADVAKNVARVAATGAAGCSVEDFTRDRNDPIYEIAFAADRVRAAAESKGDLVLTGRAENFIHGRPDLADTIARLQAYQAAGADVLYAPGVANADDIRTLVAAVDRPVNVLALPNVPPIAELAQLGVRRVSVGGGFARVAMGAVTTAARELRERGTYEFWNVARGS
ncbi:MAG TPA: isocitrate lyase/phosphoenolpyruvate mutase family protein [Acidimicrobiia bacterium]|nr:isocitrate lyase/phosphoenolpyruvate mutase family protein [Acidimicrobiia bacterium]